MKSSEIRRLFLDFFKAKDHTIVKSDSLIPQKDPTLLFTGAGMNQFKEYFLGLKTDLKRAASVQKCLRTGDLDVVGKTPYHHSFFEMLGNFSFGDYFKEEAIAWAWEFLTSVMKLPREKLYVSVHEKDEEAFQIWSRKIGIPPKLIARLGDASNFWPQDAPRLGPNGPCGPCSEIFYDQGKHYPDAQTSGFWANDESGRFAEIWNLVFTQFERREDGSLIPLQAKNIDTGMGFERLVCVMQEKQSNFETDLFQPLIRHLETKAHCHDSPQNRRSLYAICDHIRGAVVAISDGAHPSNEGRGYVIRKLIRRAVWQGRSLRLEKPFLFAMVPQVTESLGTIYPELVQAEKSVEKIIESEEKRFLETLENGLLVLSKAIENTKKRGENILPGEEVFQLYDTYGFPDELTRLVAAREGIQINRKEFERLLDEQRARAKSASKIENSIFTSGGQDLELSGLGETKFLGYETLTAEAEILWSQIEKDGQGRLILDRTPFYPEGGGQVGDQGMIRGEGFEFAVSDTQKKECVILHLGKLIKGTIKTGERAQAKVNGEKRHATKRNHTATHLLQAALREILGTHVRQVGSLVNPEKLRFDFTHNQPLRSEEIRKIETWVNQAVLDNLEVSARVSRYEEATKSGTLAFFGEKYGDQVRTIEVVGKSKELCGGTHCVRTGDIGAFIITGESSIGSGVRRIEAVTGLGAVAYAKEATQINNRLRDLFKTDPAEALRRIEKMQKRLKELEKTGTAGSEKGSISIDSLVENRRGIGGIYLIAEKIENQNLQALRAAADQIRSKTSQTIVALFSEHELKAQVVIAITKDLERSNVDAREIARSISPFIEGQAGGRKDWAQGGGKNPAGIAEAIRKLPNVIQTFET